MSRFHLLPNQGLCGLIGFFDMTFNKICLDDRVRLCPLLFCVVWPRMPFGGGKTINMGLHVNSFALRGAKDPRTFLPWHRCTLCLADQGVGCGKVGKGTLLLKNWSSFPVMRNHSSHAFER
eukprot:scaffold1982_cov358-Pavlova_lutheri.AAC.20